MRFVDTSFWVALHYTRDRNHADAARLWGTRDVRVLTTNHVVGETWTFLRRRTGHEAAEAFRRAIARAGFLAVEHVTEDLEADAWRWLRRHDERPYSFVDATGFAVMRRRRIREALAFDDDFSAAGFVEVRP